MSDFNLEVPIVQALIADSQSCSVVECATAWLKAYDAAHERGADDASALLEAATAWDLTAAEWRSQTEDGQQVRVTWAIRTQLRGQYDVCLMTYEKCAALTLAQPHILHDPG